eukprot:20992-Heterococcus_DN1.PRE.3
MAKNDAKAIATLLQRCAIAETETALDAVSRLFALYGSASLDQRVAFRDKIEPLLCSQNAILASAACTSLAKISCDGSTDREETVNVLIAALEKHARADYSDKDNVTYAIVRSIIDVHLKQLQTAEPSTKTAALLELILDVDPLIGSCLVDEVANSITTTTTTQATHLVGHVLSLVLLRPQQQYLRSSALTKVMIAPIRYASVDAITCGVIACVPRNIVLTSLRHC